MEPILFDDLAVYFSQEECVGLHPAQRSLSREATQECSQDVALMGGKNNTEINEQLSLESLELEELPSENNSIAAPRVHHPQESSEDRVGIPEMNISGGTSIYKKKLRSLLITVENHTPLVELSQCLGVKALSDILEFPPEEAKNEYKCPECDQCFSDNLYLVLHQKIHSREKKYKCGDCGKSFNYKANLSTHKRIHTGEKPYKCTKCEATFRQQSHLSRHMNSHVKEKPYMCDICKKSFTWLPGLAQHKKSHAVGKACEHANHGKYFHQKTNLALPENTYPPATQYQHSECAKSFQQPSYSALPEKSHKEDSEQHSIDDENFFSFSRFKPLQCPECDMKFPCFSELVSHQNIHIEEKPYKCETCAQSFALDSELACHRKSHKQEEPFKCSVCGKSFKVNMHFVTHKRTHRKKAL
ncbi:PREDICTED: zinc finger protein 597 isoform X2 [Chinchilla lanigera]|uniref:Zinc finger protein 597 n=1 Tax=Chinchilla lanigera TaxID=34839 RepID=A0A8C2VK09_CHILA|nr:PREDICTED: zinc finger protein 597 isoform X2 [Chinchilla lanigera]